MSIHRLSSRRTDLASRLNQHLAHTRRYLRIAGYFRASLTISPACSPTPTPSSATPSAAPGNCWRSAGCCGPSR